MSQSDKPKARDPRVDAILDKVEQLEEQNQELQSKLNHQVKRAHRLADRIGESAGVDRRTVLAYLLGGGTTAAAILSQQPQRARAAGEFVQTDTVRNLSGTDVLDIADPIQGLVSLAFNHASVSSATTVQDANLIEYDTSAASFTLTLGTTLEERGMMVVLQDKGGSAGTNKLTVDTQSGNNIDGGASIDIQHSNATTILAWNGSEWRSNRFIDTVDARTIATDELVIGGTLFKKDSNSPINVSGTSSTTYTVGDTYDHIVIIPQHDNKGFDQMQVNGDATTNYTNIDNSDSLSNTTQFNIPVAAFVPGYEVFDDRGNEIMMSVLGGATTQTAVTGGFNGNISGNITQVTLSDSGGTNQSLKARVYGRVMNI